jgi:ABC-2 type transport system permease protein
VETFEIVVGEKPVKAGIDPFNKLIDRNPKDNVKSL